jgi:hypothetical protein
MPVIDYRNKKLLSFGDDEEEAEIEIKPRKKVKSSHDMPENADIYLAEKVDASAIEDGVASVSAGKSKVDTAEKDTDKSTLFTKEKRVKMQILASEIAAVKKDIIKSRRGPTEKKEKKKKQSLVDEMRAGYTSKRSNIVVANRRTGKKVVEDEDELLGSLDAFRERLVGSSGPARGLLARRTDAAVF